MPASTRSEANSIMVKRILFICGGDTCKSRMPKVIAEQLLKESALGDEIAVDSAARGCPALRTATKAASTP
jgi:protein-tyrosine-phosphatase